MPITGGLRTRLNGPLVTDGDVRSFRLVGNHVVYLADQDTDEVTELYTSALP